MTGNVARLFSVSGPMTAMSCGLMLCTHLTDEIYECKTFISFEMTGFGERHFIDFTAEEGLKRGFEFKLPYENFNDFRED